MEPQKVVTLLGIRRYIPNIYTMLDKVTTFWGKAYEVVIGAR